jgi:heme/copper-type cytochrome/quinol oxidase subunit 2
MNQRQKRVVFAIACLTAAGLWFSALPPVGAQGEPREVSVTGDKFAFSPSTIEVQKDQIVKITFTAADMAHSFTIDEYRIAKRAGAGQSVTFEFRADRAGSWDYYCSLTHDQRCRQMRGRLVVR